MAKSFELDRVNNGGKVKEVLKALLRVLLAPYKAWAKAFDKSVSKIMEMEEPHRSWLLWQIFYGDGDFR